MAKIIPLKEKLETPPDNVIALKPWEFRRADWASKHFIQMLRSQSAALERHRNEVYKRGEKRIWHLPGHFALKGGMAYTIHSLYKYRTNEEKMREVYYLAGLIDCMINQVNPLLRTDLIRDIYKKIVTLKKILGANWYGHIDQVLFPIDIKLFNHLKYRETISGAGTMKEFYSLIRKGTDRMFDILSREYIFYTPGRGA
jgi:hypothetical protein